MKVKRLLQGLAGDFYNRRHDESLPPTIRWKVAELCNGMILCHYVVCGYS